MKFLDDVIDTDAMVDEIANGYVTVKMHPTLPLHIATYTRHCQFERRWNNITVRCRGLVFDDETRRIVAWPFPKFFNATEHDAGYPFAPPLPDESFTVFDKVDGSLGIVFWYDDMWHVASKGSFTSEQAQWAQLWLDCHDTSRLVPGNTYLCEIIYPENRIVVRYDDALTGLCLLGAYDADGDEIPLADVQQHWEPIGYLVRQWMSADGFPLSVLVQMASDNMNMNGTTATGSDGEGWVVQFHPSGIRAKIKFSEYMRLHKILTGINARDIWQAYGADRFRDVPVKVLAVTIGVSVAEAQRLISIPGGPIRPLLDNVPDEFDQWAHDTMMELNRQYLARTNEIFTEYDRIKAEIHAEHPDMAAVPDIRAVYARKITAHTDPIMRAGLFRKFDRQDIGPLVWRSLRPAAATPFRNDEEG